MNRNIATLLAIAILAVASLVHGADLDSAKGAGLVGERADGYLGLVVATTGRDVQTMVDDINAKRKAEYEQIAAKNGIALREVEALAGRKTIEKTPRGGWIYRNEWVQKP